MATNWNAVLANVNNSADILAILRKVLSLLELKVDGTTIDEVLAQLEKVAADGQITIEEALETLTFLDQKIDERTSAFNDAIEAAAAAGAGANGWTADLVAYEGGTQKQFNDAVDRKFSNVIVIDNTITDITNIVNTAPADTLIQIRNGNYTAAGILVEKNNVLIQGQSMDGVQITVSAGPSSTFMRFGKRGPDTDYHNDNLPQYNGTITYWDEAHYSPASPEHPRYKGLGIDNATIILNNANGIGSNTGVDFYRCDNPILNAKVKWTSKFAFGNGVRIHFCKDMKSDYLEVGDNENSTYTVLYYWSYGLNAGIWKIGKGATLSIDFKHSVNGYVRYLESRARGVAGNSAVNFGYGGIGNTVDKLVAIDGDVTLKSSVEFDVLRDIYIKDLHIDNPNAEGLTFMNVVGFRLDKYWIRAKSPILFNATSFYMFSNTRGITATQSSGEFVYNGNYRTTVNEFGFTKYFERRPYPLLKDAVFGKGTLVATPNAFQVIVSTVAGGIVDWMGSNGKLRRFEEGSISARGYNEAYRTSFKFEYSSPASLDNVDFGEMHLQAESGALATIVSMAQFTTPLDKCRGRFKTFANKRSFKHIWMFDSEMVVDTNRYLTSTSEYVIEMNSMIRSKISGKWLAAGRVINFLGGSDIYYTDGYDGHVVSGTIIRPSGAVASPPLVTNFSSSTGTWQPVQLENMKIYSEDLSTLLVDNAVIRHVGSLPLGISDASGGGYVNNGGCIMDRNIPFRRYFTDASPDKIPPFKPNFVGELSQNGTSDTWWKAINLTTWSKL